MTRTTLKILGHVSMRLVAADLLSAIVSTAAGGGAGRIIEVIPPARGAPQRRPSLYPPRQWRRCATFLYVWPSGVGPRATVNLRSLGTDRTGDELWNALQDDDKRRSWAFAIADRLRAVAKRDIFGRRPREPLLDVMWCFPSEKCNPRDIQEAFEIAWRWNHNIAGTFVVDPCCGAAPTHAMALTPEAEF